MMAILTRSSRSWPCGRTPREASTQKLGGTDRSMEAGGLALPSTTCCGAARNRRGTGSTLSRSGISTPAHHSGYRCPTEAEHEHLCSARRYRPVNDRKSSCRNVAGNPPKASAIGRWSVARCRQHSPSPASRWRPPTGRQVDQTTTEAGPDSQSWPVHNRVSSTGRSPGRRIIRL